MHTPALLTKVSRRPKRSSAASTIRPAVAGSVMSAATVSRSGSCDDLIIRALATNAQSRPRYPATRPAPMPLEAPVMMATFCMVMVTSYSAAGDFAVCEAGTTGRSANNRASSVNLLTRDRLTSRRCKPGLVADGCGLVLTGPDRVRRGNAVRGVEENLLQRTGQGAVPHHGRCRGQRMMVETGQDHVLTDHGPGQPDQPGPRSGDDAW